MSVNKECDKNFLRFRERLEIEKYLIVYVPTTSRFSESKIRLFGKITYSSGNVQYKIIIRIILQNYKPLPKKKNCLLSFIFQNRFFRKIIFSSVSVG